MEISRHPQPSAPEAGEYIRELRKHLGLTGSDVADAIGMSQATISKIENGLQPVSLDFVAQLIENLDIPTKFRRPLVNRVRSSIDLESTNVALSVFGQAKANIDKRQENARAWEYEASTILNFQPVVLDGILQTKKYAEAVFRSIGLKGDGLNKAIGERVKRQSVLDDSNKHLRFLITEQVIRGRICSNLRMTEQLKFLKMRIKTHPEQIGIIASCTRVPAILLTGFTIFDSDHVYIELIHGDFFANEDSVIEEYQTLFKQFATIAMYGDLAIGIIDNAIEDFAKLNQAENDFGRNR